MAKRNFPDGSFLEAVLLDPDGREVDWWDPVFSLDETDTHWIIEGASNTYEEPKIPGFHLKIRRLEAANG